MSRVAKYVVLAVIGFGLGAGVAWLQSRVEAPQGQPAAVAPVTVSAQSGSAVVPDAPPAPTQEEVMAPVAIAAAETPSPTASPADPQKMPVAGAPGGSFALTDFNGQAVTDKSWPGQYKMVFFGFTNCPEICPTALAKISAALKTLGADAAKIQPLLITVDPARDTPEALKKYLGNYEGNFVGLTGTEDQIRQTKEVYKAFAAKVPGATPDAYMVDHSAYVYFMAPDDQMLEIFGSSSTADTMAGAIKGHLATKAQ